MNVSDTAFWRLLFPSRAREQDPDFRSVLTDVLHTGLQQCGAIGLAGSLLYVGLSVLGLGYEISWTYKSFRSTGLEHQIVIMGILIVAALSVVGLVLAQMNCSLRAGRLFGFGAVILTATVATFEGALRGTFGTEYVIPMYLVIVAIVPFRPAQVLGIGGAVSLVVYGLGPDGLVWGSPFATTAEMARHLAFIIGSTVLITGTSVAIYSRHRAFGITQASLQKNRDLLRRVQAVAQVGGWEYDPEADKVQGTEELYRIMDRSEDDASDIDSTLTVYPDDARETVEEAITECIEEGTPFDLEVPMHTSNDEERWVHLRGKARERYDNTLRLIGTLQDITERHEMEERIREQERLLRSITNNVSDGIYRFAPGDGLVYANEAFADMFGYGSVDEVLSVETNKLHAHSQSESVLVRAGSEQTSDSREVVFRRKDESTFTALLSGTVVTDDHGRIEYVDGVVTDITDLKERERQLQRQRDRFETLFQNLPTPVVQAVLTDDGARVQTINREFENVFGNDAETVQGEQMCTLIGTDDDREEMKDVIQRAFNNGSLQLEVQRTTPGGLRDFQLYFAARHREGQRTEGYAMFVDVTERKERERDLREREQKIEALYTTTEGLLRAEDKDSVADRLQKVVRETFDYPLNSVRLAEDEMPVPGRPRNRSRSTGADYLDANNDPRAEIARAYRSGETVVAEDLQDVDLPVDRGDLRTAAFLPIAGHGLVSIGSERVGGIEEFDIRLLEILSTQASVVLDRIDREQDVLQSEQQFRGIFENAALGIALIDSDGHIVDSNPALQSMLHYEGTTLQGRHFEKLIYADDLSTNQHLFSQLVDGARNSYEIEKRFVREDGDVFWGNLTVSRHEGPGEATVIGMIENVDDRKRKKLKLREAKEEAEEMNRLKSAFLANMSHEIRTPLTSILGFAEAIGNATNDPDSDDEPIEEFAKRISKSGTRLLETLDSVLDLSRLESGSMSLSPKPVELTEEVKEMVDLFEQKAEQAKVELHAELPEDPMWITADQGALRRIQRNLLSNALKYTEEGGETWVRVREEDDYAVLEVEDTGIGMEPDQVEDLFSAFKQESTGTNRSHEGSGLGLAIVDRLLEQMGGSIEVETEKGVGTLFTIQLPSETHDNPESGDATDEA